MGIGKKIGSFFFGDIFRSLKVSLRYLLGMGAAIKKERIAQNEISGKNLFRDAGKCIGCRLCVNVCPTKAIRVQTEMRSQEAVSVMFDLKTEQCVSCGLCVEACPQKALIFEGMGKDVRR